ncbi:MAG: lamin tail domain-containing protein [Verrucomicrobiae bacterium]|nr:lamin tail domain-containing protein [Verrucomicrobiae bacterium]
MVASAGDTASLPSVVISEIFSDPGDAERGCEFVEILNRSNANVRLDDWQLAGAVRFVFPGGSTLEPGGRAVVALDPDALESVFGVKSLGPWDGRLSADGEKLRLLDDRAREVNEVEYGCGFPWPVVGDLRLAEVVPGTPEELFVDDEAQAGRSSSIELVHADADNRLGGAWREVAPSPGAEGVITTSSVPAILKDVRHAPQVPVSGQGIQVSANVAAGSGAIEKVILAYQIVVPGDFLPAWTPQEVEGGGFRSRRRGYDGRLNPIWNSEFESEARWTRVEMSEHSDGNFVAAIPGQEHRTLVRYRVYVKASDGANVMAPQDGDPSLNFACYVSDGIPDYEAATSPVGARTHKSELLNKLPVYALISRAQDFEACMGYSRQHRLDKGSEASKVYNWEGALVYDGVVYDHIRYRLRGGNGRYLGNGRRSMKFRFNKGNYFAAKDQQGKPYAEKWRVLECSKMFSNRMVGNFGLVDSINGRLWRLMGVPAPFTHWFHFRVVDGVEEAPDQWSGDFQGLMLAQEHYDKRFLKQHGMEKGNLYKLSDGVWGGESQARYIAPEAVNDYSDYDGIEYDLSDIRSSEWIRNRVDIDRWARFSAVKEAVRHYDFWLGANKNMVYYFAPDPQVAEGKLWLLPYDHDDTWGPCWNHGYDCVTSSVYHLDDIRLEERNMLREFRDLVWQSDQLNPLIDDLARTISDFVEADYDRWWRGNGRSGQEFYGRLESKVEDMKRFAWYGGYWPGGSVGDGGRARYLDQRADDPNIPSTPRVEFSGGSGFPVDALRFESSAYRSPVAEIFAAMEWRLAVITSPAARIDPFKEERVLEWDAAWESKIAAPISVSITVPSHVVKSGDLCRVRVRHCDSAGRWSHWSLPLEFTATDATSAPDAGVLGLVISEINYHPRAATTSEVKAGFSTSDFEWIEVQNRGTTRADLSHVRFTKGIDYRFRSRVILEPGAMLVLVRNAQAFRLRYGSDVALHDEWETGDGLANGGERLRMKGGNANETLFEVNYDDGAPWPKDADGGGATIELKKGAMVMGLKGDASNAENWSASERRDGSPGV